MRPIEDSARRPSRAAAPPSATPIRYAHRLADLKPPRFRARARHAPRHSPHRRGSPARKAPVLAEAARAMALSAPDGLKVSATMRCYCWASLARFADGL